MPKNAPPRRITEVLVLNDATPPRPSLRITIVVRSYDQPRRTPSFRPAGTVPQPVVKSVAGSWSLWFIAHHHTAPLGQQRPGVWRRNMHQARRTASTRSCAAMHRQTTCRINASYPLFDDTIPQRIRLEKRRALRQPLVMTPADPSCAFQDGAFPGSAMRILFPGNPPSRRYPAGNQART